LIAVVQSLKLWLPAPTFFTLKVIVPVGSAENFDNLKPSSDGLPIWTFTTVTFAVFGACPAFTCPDADPATTPSNDAMSTAHAAPKPAKTNVLRCMKGELLLSCQ